jgi:hypothetical protein
LRRRMRSSVRASPVRRRKILRLERPWSAANLLWGVFAASMRRSSRTVSSSCRAASHTAASKPGVSKSRVSRGTAMRHCVTQYRVSSGAKDGRRRPLTLKTHLLLKRCPNSWWYAQAPTSASAVRQGCGPGDIQHKLYGSRSTVATVDALLQTCQLGDDDTELLRS